MGRCRLLNSELGTHDEPPPRQWVWGKRHARNQRPATGDETLHERGGERDGRNLLQTPGWSAGCWRCWCWCSASLRSQRSLLSALSAQRSLLSLSPSVSLSAVLRTYVLVAASCFVLRFLGGRRDGFTGLGPFGLAGPAGLAGLAVGLAHQCSPPSQRLGTNCSYSDHSCHKAATTACHSERSLVDFSSVPPQKRVPEHAPAEAHRVQAIVVWRSTASNKP
ncbi:hypothetical protein AOQ84DRAFT_149816 [Glonium stellatum]|uniref:Uncharacterized protein n=1 Tax=Glonium stellatum TaxID=574774 RepID=A0A8E2ES88_9PEZI|nr:hypothetical protein AOQ84DRAFT_149816 [Glonium stellatum]